jgi:hypothetical protein
MTARPNSVTVSHPDEVLQLIRTASEAEGPA